MLNRHAQRRSCDPAFPCEGDKEDGMTLRTWLVGQALAGLASVPREYRPDRNTMLQDLAAQAITLADAALNLLYPAPQGEDA